MAKIIWSSVAEEDLKMISDYISIDSEIYADRVVDRIYERVSILENHTHIGSVVPEFENPVIRQLIEGNYRIIYEIIGEDEVSILSIYHSARLLKKL